MTPSLALLQDELSVDAPVEIERRERVLDEIFARWRLDSTPDALAELEKHPELGRSRSVILELACEEFWLRADRGEAPPLREFLERFPGYSTGLQRILAIESQLVAASPARFERRDWPAVGSIYRGFRLQERLGCGAFSCVYMAQDTSLADRRVVLKLTTLPGNEPEALGKLRHAHIVPVYAYFPPDSDAPAALVMPFLGRATLEDLLDRIRLEPRVPASADVIRRTAAADPSTAGTAVKSGRESFVDAVLRLVHGLCLGLAEAHGQGLLHLDIKPSNVLLADDGTLKLLDFNLTRVAGKTDSVGLGGTLPYMSPEQLLSATGAAAADLDSRSDLFSLGVVLYELLTGRHPFGPLDPAEPSPVTADLLRQRHRRDVTPVRELNPLVNPGCARLIESCLAYDPAERPCDALALAAGLQAERRWPSKVRRLRIRYPRIATAAVATGLLLLGAAAAGWSQYPDYNERCFARAVDAAREGRLADSVNLLTAGLEYAPADEDSRLLLAQCLAGEKRLDEAIAEFQTLAGGPHAVEARSGLIYCFVLRNNLENALRVANTESSHPLTPADLNNLALIHIQHHEHEAARSLLDQAIALQPNSVTVRANRATTDLYRARTIKGYLPTVGILDVEHALRQKEYGNLYYLLAQLQFASEPDTPEVRRRVEATFVTAVRHGYPIDNIKSLPAFADLPDQVPEKHAVEEQSSRSFSLLIAPLESRLLAGDGM